jgi:hypothetical protein
VFQFRIGLVHLVEAAPCNPNALPALVNAMGYQFPQVMDSAGHMVREAGVQALRDRDHARRARAH